MRPYRVARGMEWKACARFGLGWRSVPVVRVCSLRGALGECALGCERRALYRKRSPPAAGSRKPMQSGSEHVRRWARWGLTMSSGKADSDDGASALRPYAPLQIVHGGAAVAAREGRLDAFLDRWRSLGLGGIVVNHPPGGYLRDPAGWQAMREVLRAAAARGMRVWLYDEEGYPSGAAGGLVLATRPELEAIGVSWAWLPLDACEGGAGASRWRAPGMAEALLGAWSFPLDPDGRPAWREREVLSPERAFTEPVDGERDRTRVGIAFMRRLYEGTHAERNFHASRRMVNVLHPDGGSAFVAATHERYAAELGPLLRDVEAVFTDEPSWVSAFLPPLGTQRVDDRPSTWAVQYPALPWALDLPDAFTSEYGEDLVALLPLLFEDFTDAEEETRRCRARFHDLCARLYGERYFGPIRAWGRRHGVVSSGHVLGEEGLVTHVAFEGDLMAQLRQLDWPGCDVLDTDPREILQGDLCLTARFAASAARLTGARQVMCEISDFVQRKRDGTGAAAVAMRGTVFALSALGVGVYASYYHTPQGAADEDDYRRWCEAAARCCRIVREWEPVVDVALLYPIRGVWEVFRPTAEDFRAAVGRDPRYVDARRVSDGFRGLARGLLRRQIPFDIVDEAALLKAEPVEQGDGNAALRCGELGPSYRVVLLPERSVLTRAVQETLLPWVRAGGVVVAVGGGPVSAAGEGPLAPLLGQAIESVDGRFPDTLCDRLRSYGCAIPRLRALAGDTSFLLAVPFRHRDGCRGLMLANTADAPVRVAVGSPVSADWLRMDLATGRVRALCPSRIKLRKDDGACAVGVAAYGGVWLSPSAGPPGV